MMSRLFGLIFLGILGWMLGRLIDSARRRSPMSRAAGSGAASTPEPEPKSEGTMVRDRVCNKFLPRSRALVLESHGQEHFFCSETCRRQYLAGDTPGATASAPTR